MQTKDHITPHDLFAAVAMHAIIGRGTIDVNLAARNAGHHADAMMSARPVQQQPALPACTVCDDRGFYTEPYSRDRAKVPCTFCPSAPSSTASATTTAAEAPLGNNA